MGPGGDARRSTVTGPKHWSMSDTVEGEYVDSTGKKTH
jgi:hypothetical protein